jgi:hypothetical protein
VSSVLPSSITSISTREIPGIRLGMAAIVSAMVCSSLRAGIWTISFIGASLLRSREQCFPNWAEL